MSTLFNQKEEVLSLELTKYGKKCIANGYFLPEHYSFFDDSIIYDRSYYTASIEDTNLIQDRILKQSLSFKALNLCDNNNRNFKYEDLLGEPLGSSDPFSDYAPAWDLKVYKKRINYLESESNFYYKKVFDVEDIEYHIERKSLNSKEYKILDKEYFLIDLKELNCKEELKNFDIELIMINEYGVEKKLFFQKPKNNIINDIIFEESELPSGFFDYNPSNEDVIYYFDILADEEIDVNILAEASKTPAIQPRTSADSPRITDYDGEVGPEC